MKRFPNTPAEMGPDDNQTTKRKRRRNGASLGQFAVPVEAEVPERPTKKEAGDREKMVLGGLLVKKGRAQERSKPAKGTKTPEKTPDSRITAEAATVVTPHGPVGTGTKPEAINSGKPEKGNKREKAEDRASNYPLLPEQEIPPTALNLGEAVLYSKDTDENSSAEGVFILHDKKPKKATRPPQPAAEAIVSHTPPERRSDKPEPEKPKPAEPSKETPAPTFPPETEPVVMAAGGGEVPPVDPPAPPSFEFPPDPPFYGPTAAEIVAASAPLETLDPVDPLGPLEPAQAYRAYAQRQHRAATHSRSGEALVATSKDVEDAEYYGTKRGLSRGVTTGLFVGLLYGRHKRKKSERKAEKRYKALDKKLNTARKSYDFERNEQDKRTIRTGAELAATKRKLHDTEQRFQTVLSAPQAQAERQPLSPERTTAKAVPEQLVVEGQLEIPENHYLKKEGWVVTEHEKKSGKLVTEPSFEYGREYHNERAQEIGRAQHRNTAAGEIALVAAATTTSHTGSSTSGNAAAPSPVQIPNATTQGSPSVVRPTQQAAQTTTPETAQKTDDTAPLWPWVAALAAIALCLAVLLL